STHLRPAALAADIDRSAACIPYMNNRLVEVFIALRCSTKDWSGFDTIESTLVYIAISNKDTNESRFLYLFAISRCVNGYTGFFVNSMAGFSLETLKESTSYLNTRYPLFLVINHVVSSCGAQRRTVESPYVRAKE